MPDLASLGLHIDEYNALHEIGEIEMFCYLRRRYCFDYAWRAIYVAYREMGMSVPTLIQQRGEAYVA